MIALRFTHEVSPAPEVGWKCSVLVEILGHDRFNVFHFAVKDPRNVPWKDLRAATQKATSWAQAYLANLDPPQEGDP